MDNFKRKTFDNSYLFNQEVNKHHKILTEYIIKADRIDKSSEAFSGIIEDVKRVQNSSILYTILLMDNVVLLCDQSGAAGLSKAFKVFEAKDLRTDRQPKIFIDVTKLITLKEGYFVCSNIGVFITYLFQALGNLLYSKSTFKLLSNSNISIAGTECFVSMFTYILDYLRIVGYSQSKEKISYLAGIYFLHHMMDKDIDNYTRNIAAKVSGLNASNIQAFDLYYKEEDLKDINSFIKLIATTFNLKGLTLEVFISKWCYLFDQGGYFGTELLTSFMNVVIAAYCGSYVVNQKQVERCCGTSMVKFVDSILKLGVEEFDKRKFMEASELDKMVYRDKNTIALKESLFSKVPKEAKFTPDDWKSKSKTKTRMKAMIDYYKSINKTDKIGKSVYGLVTSISLSIDKWAIKCTDGTYEIGVMETLISGCKEYMVEKDKNKTRDYLKKLEEGLSKSIEKNRDNDKEIAARCGKVLIEVRKCINIVK